MQSLKIGDVVIRKSYNGDIIFRIEQLVAVAPGKMVAVLKGINMRLLADAPVEDLILFEQGNLQTQLKSISENEKAFLRELLLRRNTGKKNYRTIPSQADYFDVPGKVLHVDGDNGYLQKCLEAYNKLNIPVNGYWIAENDMPTKVAEYVLLHQPDIVVITGHDGFLKDTKDFANIDNYRNSRYFVDTVKAVRKICPDRDETVIFAGACQSHYEALIASGANFASSPKRVLIHAFDPVFVVEKISFTSFRENLDVAEIISSSITGAEGIGGVETRGKFRRGYPKSPY